MTDFSKAIAPVAALLLSVAILLTGNGLLGTLIPVRASLEHFTSLDLGLLGSFYYIGFTAGCLAGPALISRVGHIRAYLAFVSAASALALIHAMAVDPLLWWALRAMTGFSLSVLYIVIESWLNERADNSTRGLVFSIYTVVNLTVITVGQMMLNLADPRAFSLFALCSILVSLASLPVALTRAQSPQPVPVVIPGLSRLLALSPVGFVACFAHGLSSGSFWSLGPVFVLNSGFDTLGVSLFMSATVLGGACGQYPVGRYSDRTDRRRVIVVTCLCAAAAGLALTFLSDGSLLRFSILGFCFGVFAFPVYAVSVAHANDLASPTDYVEISSGLLLVFGLGCVLGPALTTTLQAVVQVPSLFLFTSAIHLALALFTTWRILERSPAPAKDKVEFKDALVATRTIAPIDIYEISDDLRPAVRDGGK